MVDIQSWEDDLELRVDLLARSIEYLFDDFKIKGEFSIASTFNGPRIDFTYTKGNPYHIKIIVGIRLTMLEKEMGLVVPHTICQVVNKPGYSARKELVTSTRGATSIVYIPEM